MPSLDPISTGLSIAQAGLGVYQEIKGSADLKKAMAQRRAYQTPNEAYQILDATEANAGQGLDPYTLSYLTGQTNNATSKALGVAERLNADPNTLSALLGSNIDSLMKIGNENHEANMKNFGNYINALGMISKDKEAEWASQQDIVKDKIQTAATQKQQGVQNIFNAANSFIETNAASKIGDLNNENKTTSDQKSASSLAKKLASIISFDGSPVQTNSNQYNGVGYTPSGSINPNVLNIIQQIISSNKSTPSVDGTDIYTH